jgi:catechol 2,3-dioxygenase-like lactoylglutathione lyase family enzyme
MKCCPCYIAGMSIKRMDHVTVVVEDLPAAIAFFTTLGMALEGQTSVEGDMVDRLCGLEGTRADIAMMRTPDGNGRVELTKYHRPALVPVEPAIAPPNTLGLRQIMFAVEDIDDTVARMRDHGADLLGEMVQYGDSYRLCYLRGPEGIIIALAEELF